MVEFGDLARKVRLGTAGAVGRAFGRAVMELCRALDVPERTIVAVAVQLVDTLNTADACTVDESFKCAGAGSEMKHFCISRHNERINMLFMDWSTREVGLKELWTLKWHKTFNTAGLWTRAGGAVPTDWPLWMRNFTDY